MTWWLAEQTALLAERRERQEAQMDGLVTGRIVYFVFDEAHARAVAQQRVGYAAHTVAAGDIYPAMVVRTWDSSDIVNLKVMLDGPDTYWARSVRYDVADAAGAWHWMFDGQDKRYEPKAAQERP